MAIGLGPISCQAIGAAVLALVVLELLAPARNVAYFHATSMSRIRVQSSIRKRLTKATRWKPIQVNL